MGIEEQRADFYIITFRSEAETRQVALSMLFAQKTSFASALTSRRNLHNYVRKSLLPPAQPSSIHYVLDLPLFHWLAEKLGRRA